MSESNAATVGRRGFLERGIVAGLGVVGAGTDAVLARGRSDRGGRRTSIRVLSYNIHNGVGTDGVYDLQRIADVIETYDPDLVALQEVHDQNRAAWEDASPTSYDAQPELLAEWLDMEAVFASNRDWPDENGYRRRAGNLLLSKHPILEANRYSYDEQIRFSPPNEDVQERRLIEARINVRGAHLWVYNAHLQSGADGERLAVRTGQLDELLSIVGGRSGPRIVAGDLNAPDGQYEFVERVGSNENYRTIADRYVDVLRAVDADDPTYPAPPKNSVVCRIDYVFATPDVGVEDGRVITYDERAASPSDHLPVVADLTLRRGAAGRTRRHP